MVQAYELVVLLAPDVTSDALQKIQDKVAKILTSAGGKISKTDMWGRRPTAFKIKKHSEAVYVVYSFSLDTSKAQETERAVQLTDGVIRHVFVVAGKQAKA